MRPTALCPNFTFITLHPSHAHNPLAWLGLACMMSHSTYRGGGWKCWLLCRDWDIILFWVKLIPKSGSETLNWFVGIKLGWINNKVIGGRSLPCLSWWLVVGKSKFDSFGLACCKGKGWVWGWFTLHKYCIQCHQFYLSCSILIVNQSCSVTDTICKPDTPIKCNRMHQ